MNKRLIAKSSLILATALLASGSAQACLPFQPPGVTCPVVQDAPRSCPPPAKQERDSAPCPAPGQDLWGAVGTLAAGGMGIAVNVMRAVRDGLSGEAATNRGI